MARPYMTSSAPAIAGSHTGAERRPSSRQRRHTAPRWWFAAAVSLVVGALAACGPSTPAGAPPAPRDVTATAIAGGVRLTWVDQSSNEDGFVILRKDAGMEGEPSDEVGIAAADEQSFDDFSTEEEGSYVYGVAAVNVVGRSDVALQSRADPVTPLPGIDVSLTFDGDGVVTIAGGGVRKVCVDDCIVSFAEGTEVELDAEDAEDAVFAGWAGACDGAGTCTLEVDEPLEVEARFRRHVLKVRLDGDSPLSITVDKIGDFGESPCILSVGGVCSFAYSTSMRISVYGRMVDARADLRAFEGDCADNQVTETVSYCVANVSGATTIFASAVRRPVATSDSYELNEDAEFTADKENGLLANDIDSEGDQLSAHLVSGPTHGQLDLRADGSFTFRPGEDVVETATIQYLARDAYGNESESTTVTLNINPVNDPPVFTISGDPPPTYGDGQVKTVDGFATGMSVGGGPDEANSQVLTGFNVRRVSGNLPDLNVSISPTGSLTYTPPLTSTGEATYEAILSDNGGNDRGGSSTSAPKRFKITVQPVTLSISTQGSGTVKRDPDSNSGEYGYGTTVHLTPEYDAQEWTFAGWEGCTPVGPGQRCRVTMDGNKNVTARFNPIVSVQFANVGSSPFVVNSNPVGITNCWSFLPPGDSCSAPFVVGTTVTISASSGAYYFNGVQCANTEPTNACTFQVLAPTPITISSSSQ